GAQQENILPGQEVHRAAAGAAVGDIGAGSGEGGIIAAFYIDTAAGALRACYRQQGVRRIGVAGVKVDVDRAALRQALRRSESLHAGGYCLESDAASDSLRAVGPEDGGAVDGDALGLHAGGRIKADGDPAAAAAAGIERRAG